MVQSARLAKGYDRPDFGRLNWLVSGFAALPLVAKINLMRRKLSRRVGHQPFQIGGG